MSTHELLRHPPHEVIGMMDLFWVKAMVAFTLLTALVVCIRPMKEEHASGTKPLPYPASTLPVLGNTLDTMKKQRHRLYDWLTEETALQGGAVWGFQIVGRPRTIVVTSPHIYEDVLKHQVDNFPKGAATCYLVSDFFGNGILGVDGEDWHTQRKTAGHLFSLQMMKDVVATVISEKVERFHHVLLEHSRKHSEEPLSMRQTLTHFTSDVFIKIGFGVELNCLERSLSGDNDNLFIDSFSLCARVIRSRFQQPRWLWRLKRFLNIGDEKKFKQAKHTINALMYDIIAKSMEPCSSDTPRPRNLVSLFLDNKMEASPRNLPIASLDNTEELEMVRDMVINFVFAGKDTTSVSMSWFIVMMNRYPEVASKLRQEIREKVPSLCRGDLVVPTVEQLKDLTYLDAAINENLRLNPPVVVASRTASMDTTLSDGTFIHSGDRVMLATYAQARQTAIWGEDAAEFNPERWLDPLTGKLVVMSPFKFSAFLGGPRTCVGRKFARMQMKVTLAMLLSRFELTTVDDPWSITYEMALALSVKGPLMVTVRALGDQILEEDGHPGCDKKELCI